MRKIFLVIISTALTAVALQSCIPRYYEPKVLDCPKPVQGCQPIAWNGLPLDTTPDAAALTGFRYSFRPVMGINTDSDEWQLSFIDGREAMLTFTDAGLQKLIKCEMVMPDAFFIRGGIIDNLPGHKGAVNFSGDMAALAYSPYALVQLKSKYPNFAPESESFGNSRIVLAEYSNDVIKSTYEFPQTASGDSVAWSSHPAIAPGGKVLVFAGEIAGGIGGIDLWYFVKNGAEWDGPFNLGPTVNSKCDDITPFISESGEFFFSSAGHDNVGGFDIFSAEINPEFFENPETGKDYFSNRKNLRPPLNTTADEIFPGSPGDTDSLFYYSSNQFENSRGELKYEGGGFDIFVRTKVREREMISKNEKEFEPEFEQDFEISDNKQPEFGDSATLRGRVYNKQTNQPVDSARITVKEVPNPNSKKEFYTDNAGNFEIEVPRNVELEVTAEKGTLFFDTRKIIVRDNEPVVNLDLEFFLPDIAVIRINFPTDEFNNPYKFTLDSNGIETGRPWQRELDILAENIRLDIQNLRKIVLVGHTDDVGTNEYNIGLGSRRVNFVKSELIKRGVPGEIIETRTAGEEEPLGRRPGEELDMFRKRLRRVTVKKLF